MLHLLLHLSPYICVSACLLHWACGLLAAGACICRRAITALQAATHAPRYAGFLADADGFTHQAYVFQRAERACMHACMHPCRACHS